MLIGDMAWVDVEEYLKKDDRIMIDAHDSDGSVKTILDIMWDWIKRDIKLTEPGRYRTWLKKGHL